MDTYPASAQRLALTEFARALEIATNATIGRLRARPGTFAPSPKVSRFSSWLDLNLLWNIRPSVHQVANMITTATAIVARA